MSKPRKFINGVCEQLLFSPKGTIEGALIQEDGARLQLTMPRNGRVDLGTVTAPGKRLRVLAIFDKSNKAAEGSHPVWLFDTLADAKGLAMDAPDGHFTTTIKGVVAELHFARHGQPNGVVLKSGEFIHLRPQGMAMLGLAAGSKVSAAGSVRMTCLGTRLLEAREVNGIALD
jgi:hypothetical protein